MKDLKKFYRTIIDNWTPFCLIQCILFITCPILEYTKIILYYEYKLPLEYTIEFLYLFLIIFQLVLITSSLFCCCCIPDVALTNFFLSISAILWIIIPIIYSVKTVHDLGEIPFFCPSNYDYKFSRLRFICQIRTSNFILMWIASISVLFSWIYSLISEIFRDVHVNDDVDFESNNDDN